MLISDAAHLLVVARANHEKSAFAWENLVRNDGRVGSSVPRGFLSGDKIIRRYIRKTRKLSIYDRNRIGKHKKARHGYKHVIATVPVSQISCSLSKRLFPYAVRNANQQGWHHVRKDLSSSPSPQRLL